ncbi:MAG: pilus assembly protein, partial [Actinomycetota bacterium]|nr:pilus assembly protein [Actinomycetota bacterium]
MEFALVFPIFVFVLGGLITFGVILAQKQQITTAAADGARSAVGAASPAAAQAAARARVEGALGVPTGSPPN